MGEGVVEAGCEGGGRGRAAAVAAAISAAAAAAATLDGSTLAALGAPLAGLLVLEAAACGAVGGGATAAFYGRPGLLGALRATAGGALCAAIALTLFALGGAVWLKGAAATAAFAPGDLGGAAPVAAILFAGFLHAFATSRPPRADAAAQAPHEDAGAR